MRTIPAEFPVIHAVTDSTSILRPTFLARAAVVMKALGSRGAVHLRSYQSSGHQLHAIAQQLARLQESTGCWLIVNDRLDIARAVRARAAQLTSQSMKIADARIVAGDMPIGSSIHTVDEAVEAEKAGASWVVAGTVFDTPSHPGKTPARVEFIEQVAEAVRIPIIAIGGILPEHIAELRNAGAHGVATIRGAGWDLSTIDADRSSENALATRADPAFSDPLTRYISAYDSDSGSGQDDHAHGERRPPGARPG